HDPGVEVRVEAGTGAHASLWRLDRHPVAGGNAPHLGRLRGQLHLRMRRMLAPAGQSTVLTLPKKRVLDTGPDKWKPGRQKRLTSVGRLEKRTSAAIAYQSRFMSTRLGAEVARSFLTQPVHRGRQRRDFLA